jgi:hypothetical protein
MLPASLLILAVVIFRCAVGASGDETLRAWANFSPLAAMALCSGAIFPKKWALVVPLAAQLLSDLGLSLVAPNYVFSWSYSLILVVAYATVVAVGWAVRAKYSPLKLLGASIIGTLLFYVITNTTSFWTDPGYAKTFSGWVQALTLGLPGYPPTYVFLFKSLAGDLLFTTLILLSVGAVFPSRKPEAEPESESEPTPAEA